jgi:hypothetical protein
MLVKRAAAMWARSHDMFGVFLAQEKFFCQWWTNGFLQNTPLLGRDFESVAYFLRGFSGSDHHSPQRADCMTGPLGEPIVRHIDAFAEVRQQPFFE